MFPCKKHSAVRTLQQGTDREPLAGPVEGVGTTDPIDSLPRLGHSSNSLHAGTRCARNFLHVFANPLSKIFVADHLRPAAKKAGVPIEDGQRFGLHNLRHSLSNWMVNKAKIEPKTVQGILRHAKIQTTLDLYTQEDGDETLAAQGEYLTALGVATQLVQLSRRSVGWIVG